MKHFLEQLFQQILKFKTKVFLLFSLILILGQFGALAGKIYENSAARAVVYAEDNDGGRAIQTAMITRWWNSNHFAPYGPLYFRLTHTFAYFIKPFDDVEMNHHFALMMISLISLFGFAYFFSGYFFKESWLKLLFIVCAVSALSTQDIVNMIFRPHPDILLFLIVAIATFQTCKFIFDEKEENFRLSALMWGVAVGTKATTLLFTPAFVFLFFPSTKARFIKMLEYALWMFAAYTLIGFPQSLSYFKVTKFLIFESRNSVLGNLDSVIKYITYSINDFGHLCLLLIFIMSTLLKFEKPVWDKRHTKILVFSSIPFCFMLTRQMLSTDLHFVFPFVSCLVAGFTFLLLKSFSFTERPYWIAVIFVLPLIPSTYELRLKSLQKCRAQSREFQFQLKQILEKGEKVAHDPYLAIPNGFEGKHKQFWGLRWVDVRGFGADYVAVRKDFYMRYIDSPDAFRPRNQDKSEFPIRGEFYRSLNGMDRFVSPDNDQWVKVYSNQCEMNIYKKIK